MVSKMVAAKTETAGFEAKLNCWVNERTVNWNLYSTTRELGSIE